MKTKYVPILRWKTGEKNCLETLSSEAMQQIIPFIEVFPPSDSGNNEVSAERKFSKLINSFNHYWNSKPLYLYLSEDWYSTVDNPEQISDIYQNFFASTNHPYAIPAFDILDEINISNLHSSIKSNGICLRVTGNSFASLTTKLNKYTNNGWISPHNTDLLLDLQFVTADTYPKKAVLTAAFSDIPNCSDYRSIIVSCCSFPKDMSKLQSDTLNEFIRYETEIHSVALKLQEHYQCNYIYADYGPMNLDDVAFMPYMVPNFKIKYTTPDKYLIAKGFSLKKGGLDLPNVATCCRQITNHPQYSGEFFSHGDKIISDTAKGIAPSSGNLTNWVGYSFNHHITLILSIL